MKLILSVLFFLLLGGFFIWVFGPDIASDYKVDSKELQESRDYKVDKASCKSKVFVISTCEINVSHISDGSTKEFNYFILNSLGGESVYPLVSNNGALTTNIGIDYFWNRVIVLLLIGLFLFIAPLFALFKMATGRLPEAAS